MGSRIPQIRRLYKFKPPTVLDEKGSNLPEGYKKFYKEWKLTPPQPVHYIPSQCEWKRNDETGEVKRVVDVPIPVLYPPESHQGIWGGEGVVKGFQKRHPLKRRIAHFWVPQLIKSVAYSEILDKRFSLTMTNRTIDLILENHGFDNYILKTKACDLQSSLALKMKRQMLLALYNKDLYPDNPVKAQEVYEKYKHYLDEYTLEDIEWYGLTIDEACKKWERDTEVKPVPLKIQFRKNLLAQLAAPPEPDEGETVEEKSWLQKINPFGKK